MKYLILSLLLSFNAYAVPVNITFTTPTTRTDGSLLTDKDITAYKYFAVNGYTGVITEDVFSNTGNMTGFSLDLLAGHYVLCMYAKTSIWSASYTCAVFNTNSPNAPDVCN